MGHASIGTYWHTKSYKTPSLHLHSQLTRISHLCSSPPARHRRVQLPSPPHPGARPPACRLHSPMGAPQSSARRAHGALSSESVRPAVAEYLACDILSRFGNLGYTIQGLDLISGIGEKRGGSPSCELLDLVLLFHWRQSGNHQKFPGVPTSSCHTKALINNI